MTRAVKSVVFFEAVDRGDVRMVECREHFGFAPKHDDAAILRS